MAILVAGKIGNAESDVSLFGCAYKAKGLKQYEAQHIQWFTDSEVLRIDYDKNDEKVLHRVNVRTGEIRRLTGLTRLYRSVRGYEIKVSPNLKYVIIAANTEPRESWVLANWEGNERGRFPITRVTNVTHSGIAANSYMRWMADSLHVAEITQEREKPVVTVRIANVVTGKVRPLVISHYDASTGWANITADGHIVWDTWNLPRYYSTDRIMDNASENAECHYTKYALEPSGKTETWEVHPPDGTYIRNLKMNPKGDKLCWIVQSTAKAWELRISSLRGTSSKRICQLPSDFDLMADVSLKWLPSGQAVSLAYKDNLYIVQIP